MKILHTVVHYNPLYTYTAREVVNPMMVMQSKHVKIGNHVLQLLRGPDAVM